MYLAEVASRAGKVVARVAFSDRSGGYSQGAYASLNLANHVGDAAMAVGFNRSVFADRLGLPSNKLTWPGLVHSADVGIVDSDIEFFPDVDGLITKSRKRALLTMGADCAMLLLVDPEQKVVASGHIGWKGASLDAFGNLLAAFQSQGAKFKDTKLFIGPTICAACYSVDENRQAEVAKYLPAAVVGTGVDLRIGIGAAAQAEGIKIENVGGCNSCDANYFSFRRDGQTGRQAGAVFLT